MYNTSFLCTYKLHDDEEDQDTLYRHEYLYAFGLTEYDSDKIMKTLEYIYNKLKDDADFIEIIESHSRFKSDINNNNNNNNSNNNNSNNHEIVLQFLFSFHTFNLFHACLTYLLSDNKTIMCCDSDMYKRLCETFIKNKKLLIDEISKK
jgi:ATP-dependent Zn protease